MTDQRFAEIEDAVLCNLVFASSFDENPFSIDPAVFSTPFKKQLAEKINDAIEKQEGYALIYNIDKWAENDVNIGIQWISVQSLNANQMSMSLLRLYYNDIVMEYKEKILEEVM